ncbi:glycosyltransferase [Prevotella sp. E9-3]|uniref:glycosyltransferase n=1 Tax=Prevotella sp. E9-3 TaxID=2913621 RepID=UPI001ED9FA53|nr:glycosyltransferase [Prevotella sp. E9-3]UKK48263.1 glycosyltransferase [Prevotella sp. E9-3]
MTYSFIVPVYNRPDEVDELLQSLCTQTLKDFEVIVVEDGSKITCKDVCDKFANILDLHYYYKENSGPGQSRNYGVERAHGEYVIIIDSDAVAPEGFLQAIDDELQRQPSDAWGGPDAAHESFTNVQKAISYAMTSFFTTGGIRGGKKQLDKFYPRSFNLGIRREAYLALGGFSKTRFSKMSLYGEDIDFSIRIYKAGYSCRLFPEAWVWHKRRTDFHKFWRQIYNSGYARINLWRMYPEALKLVHLLPAVFTLGTFALILVALVGVLFNTQACLALTPLLLYTLLIFIDSAIRNRSLYVGFLSIPASFTQLIGYGIGFIESWWTNCVMKKNG